MPFRSGVALVWSYSRPHRSKLAAGVLLGLFATATMLATPLATKWVLDSLETGVSLARPIMLLIGLLLIGTVAGFAQSVLLGKLAERIVFDARHSLIRRFFMAKLEQVQRFKTGELVTRVTSDTVLLREAATSSIVQLVNGTVSLIGTIALMAYLDWPLLLTTLLALVIVGVMFGVLVPYIGRAQRRAQDAIGKLGGTLEGGVRALRTVKSSRAEAREIGRVVAKADEAAKHSVRAVWFAAASWSLAGAGMQLAIIVILGIGAGRVALGTLAVSTLVAFLLYAFNIVDPITALAGAFATLQTGLAAAARIRETEHLELEDTASRPNVAHPHVVRAGAPVLALRGVSATYEGAAQSALHDVTLDIPRTGHIALVGPSGAGKTTVLSLLLRFIQPSNGHLELDGVPYTELSIDDVRSRIAYVEQETPIIPGTVRENVLFRTGTAPSSRDARAGNSGGDAVSAGAGDQEAWAALAAVLLDDKVRSLPEGLDTEVADTNLSGGERQRLAVARALVRRPDVLLLDEVTAQLDGVTEAAIHRVISDASRTGAVVTIAHRLSTVLEADRIILLERGSVRDSGTHDELLARDGLYKEFITALRIGAAPA
ncbi:ABC transporter permease [Leucobacter sp. G161]|nr:ABC transporter permease [Leucobacter sp. G161]